MRLVVYGTFRQGEQLSFADSIIYARRGKYETIELSGLRMYVVGECPGAKLGTKKDKAIVELWELDLAAEEEARLLRFLDRIEGVYAGLYKRNHINTPKGQAIIYTICGDVTGYPQIKDWKEWQKKSYKKRMRILMEAGGAKVAIYTKASI